MITPENQIPPDDSENSEREDQQSQQDIHSNGLDERLEVPEEDNDPKIDLLQQASDASEPSFTLNVDKGVAPKADKNKKE